MRLIGAYAFFSLSLSVCLSLSISLPVFLQLSIWVSLGSLSFLVSNSLLHFVFLFICFSLRLYPYLYISVSLSVFPLLSVCSSSFLRRVCFCLCSAEHHYEHRKSVHDTNVMNVSSMLVMMFSAVRMSLF